MKHGPCIPPQDPAPKRQSQRQSRFSQEKEQRENNYEKYSRPYALIYFTDQVTLHHSPIKSALNQF
jgi:hypothetical protein